MSAPLVVLSLTRAELDRLSAGGPRRDVVLLAERAGAELLLRDRAGQRRGIRAKLFGPHLRQAWKAASRHRAPATIFADGEHVGLPLAFALAVRRKRGTRLVILGHLVDKPWKRALLWLASRAVARGTLVLHSETQRARVEEILPSGWDARLLPYQVDTEFWRPDSGSRSRHQRPLIISVGAENRDHQTLIEAARDLPIDVRVAAGSHWARSAATAQDLPANVEFLSETLSFEELRELYREAGMVVVSLHPGSNQAGVTTILEAMSMRLPVIVSATDGQREVVRGPLVSASGEDATSTADRGPQVFGYQPADEANGLYVPPGDATALSAAIRMLLEDPNRANRMAASGRASAARYFSVELFAERFAELLVHGTAPAEAAAAKAVAT